MPEITSNGIPIYNYDPSWLQQVGQSVKNTYDANNPAQYFDPNLINQYFNLGRQNLSAQQGTAVSRMQSDAGAFAASKGYLNPGAFVNRAGSNVYSAYAPQFGQLEQSRTGALQANNIGLYNALFQQLQANRQYSLGVQQQNLAQQYYNAQANPNTLDYMSVFLKALPALVGMF